MEYFKVILSLLALLNCATMWGNDGDTFVAKSSEGIEMTFVVVSEAEKTCKVGTDIKEKAAIEQDQNGILTIPESVNGYTVVAIGKYAFYFLSEYYWVSFAKYNQDNRISCILPQQLVSNGNRNTRKCGKYSGLCFLELSKTRTREIP